MYPNAHKGARYLGVDMTNFYLGADHALPSIHTYPPIKKFPQEIKDEYEYVISDDADSYTLEICEGIIRPR